VEPNIYLVAHLKCVCLHVTFEARIEEICTRIRVQLSARWYKVEILAMAPLALLDFAVGANPKHSNFERIEYNLDIDYGERRSF
jgi:hypothetical protein